MKLLDLPFKNKIIASFIDGLSELDYPQFNKLFVRNDNKYEVKNSPQQSIPSKYKILYPSQFKISDSIKEISLYSV